ncbi:MAG: (2Fe-2S)-binding protein [Cellvibrionales bacterium]|jgi:bacterioferritin-associated ferredoxin|nr:(2Fe-2S)-binding protein [Cellvibrionales bacterium]
MYICLCNRITESEIDQAIHNGSDSLRALQQNLSLGTNCGCCLEVANEMLKEAAFEKEQRSNALFYAA